MQVLTKNIPWDLFNSGKFSEILKLTYFTRDEYSKGTN